MNSKQAKRLKIIAFRISPQGTSIVTKTGYTDKGVPYVTKYNTGTRVTYQNLKRRYMALPRADRAAYLDAMEDL